MNTFWSCWPILKPLQLKQLIASLFVCFDYSFYTQWIQFHIFRSNDNILSDILTFLDCKAEIILELRDQDALLHHTLTSAMQPHTPSQYIDLNDYYQKRSSDLEHNTHTNYSLHTRSKTYKYKHKKTYIIKHNSCKCITIYNSLIIALFCYHDK